MLPMTDFTLAHIPPLVFPTVRVPNPIFGPCSTFVTASLLLTGPQLSQQPVSFLLPVDSAHPTQSYDDELA